MHSISIVIMPGIASMVVEDENDRKTATNEWLRDVRREFVGDSNRETSTFWGTIIMTL